MTLFRGAKMVRPFAIMLLIGSILVCPFYCGAVEVGHSAHHVQGTNAAGTCDLEGPEDCPQEGDNCICQGAVQAADIRIPGPDLAGSPLLTHETISLLDHAPCHSFTHLTCAGTPTGLAGWGDTIRVRALLQDFRC